MSGWLRAEIYHDYTGNRDYIQQRWTGRESYRGRVWQREEQEKGERERAVYTDMKKHSILSHRGLYY